MVLKLSPYRKLDPGSLEETVFFDHPSGKNRIATQQVAPDEVLGGKDKRGPFVIAARYLSRPGTNRV